MGSTKKYFYQEENIGLSNLCKALGHPARISIVELLSKNQDLNCTDFKNSINLAQSTISHHLNILHQNGIIGYEVINSNSYYRLHHPVLDQINEFLEKVNVEQTSITNQVYYPANRP